VKVNEKSFEIFKEYIYFSRWNLQILINYLQDMSWTCPSTRVQDICENMKKCGEACPHAPHLWSPPAPPSQHTPPPAHPNKTISECFWKKKKNILKSSGVVYFSKGNLQILINYSEDMSWTCPCTRVQDICENMKQHSEACPYLWSLPPPPLPPTNTQIKQNLKLFFSLNEE
jgi:hypothetical protein